MATETLRPTAYTTPDGASYSCVGMTVSAGDCKPSSFCSAGTVIAAAATWRAFPNSANKPYYTALQLQVPWLSTRFDGETFCANQVIRLEYSVNNGSSWISFSGFPKQSNELLTQSGTALQSLATSTNLTQVRVRAYASSAANTPCPPPEFEPEVPGGGGGGGGVESPRTCTTQLQVTDVRLVATFTIPTGACCSDTSCTITTQAGCSGSYKGNNSVCSPNPCEVTPSDPTGACCSGSDCSVSTQANCAGSYKGDHTVCSPNPCAVLGACCSSTGGCTLTTEQGCANSWLGANSVCSPNPCQLATGACCNGTTCTQSIASACAGTYQGDATSCSPSPCGSTSFTRACCVNGVCSVMTQDACTAQAGTWVSSSSTCSGVSCPQPDVSSNVVM